MAKSKGLNWKDFRRLGDLQKQLELSLGAMIELVENTLHKNPYTKEEVCNILEVTEGELNQISLSEKSWNGKHQLKLDNLFWLFAAQSYDLIGLIASHVIFCFILYSGTV